MPTADKLAGAAYALALELRGGKSEHVDELHHSPVASGSTHMAIRRRWPTSCLCSFAKAESAP